MEKKMNKLLIFVCFLISSALLTGCAGNKVSEENYSGFLHDYSVLKPAPNDKDTLSYVAPGIDWHKYNSVMVDKVLVITSDGEQKKDSELLVAIADKLHDLMEQNISKSFNLVNHAGEGTVRIQAAITSVYASYDDLKAYQYVPIAAVFTGAKRAAGAEEKSVRVVAEFKLVDSVDGQLLGEAIDLKSGERKQDKDSAILLADVVPILEQWAHRITDRLNGLRARVK